MGLQREVCVAHATDRKVHERHWPPIEAANVFLCIKFSCSVIHLAIIGGFRRGVMPSMAAAASVMAV